MRRSKLILTLGLVAGTTTALIAACSFPSVTFAPEEGGASSGGTSGGPGAEAAAGSDGTAPDVDAASAGDAETGPPKGDAAPEDAPHDAVPPGQDAAGCCDCDGDGFFDRTRPGCTGKTPVDCDDNNVNVNAGETWSALPAESKWKGDWNCDTHVDKFYSEGLTCSSKVLTGLLSGQTCDQFKGFDNSVVCGSQGNYITCKAGTLTCVTDTTKTQLIKQQCQ